LEIKAGEFVALTGPSGSGKTTLANLILGLYKPTEGFIEISKVQPREAIKKWPGKIGYVPQNVELIEGTIRENILVGNSETEFSDSDILQILNVCQLKNFLETLDHGLNTRIGSQGINLSGGQKQRIGLARALLSKPTLLVLDEATSSLDNETENLITKSINRLKGTVTIVVIAHRLDTLKECEVIYRVADSKVECVGNYNDLVAKKSIDLSVELG
jgi:ATP-binding cassette subfamily C protein